jgi:UTP--glucose-1-phosphate uridylyltransferase
MQKITKAVIAAAGRGTRFLPAVKQYPKELIAILDKPQIQYLVEELIGTGVTEICIVYRHGDPTLKRYFTPDPVLEKYLLQNNKINYIDSLKEIWSKVTFKFVPQHLHLPYGNASPILAAKSFIKNDNFFYLFGDDLTIEKKPGTFLTEMSKIFFDKKADGVIAVQPVPWEEISRYGSILFDKNDKNRILDVMEKVPRDIAPSNVTQLGRFLFNHKIIDTIKSTPVNNGELWLADANASLAKTGNIQAAYTPDNAWMTTGDPMRWLKANIVLALSDPRFSADIKDFIKSI